MPDKEEPLEESQLPAFQIIKQIKEGIVDPKKLPPDIRQACVECLLMQFMSIPKIALLMNVDDRTIQRDKKAIDQRNSQKPSIDYSLELIAELKRKSDATQEQLMELTRDKDGSVQEKGQALFYLGKLLHEQIKLMQSLGYLPVQPLKIEQTISQESGRDVTQLKIELAEAEKVANERGRADDPAIAGLIKAIKQEIAIAEANNNMDELKKLISPPPKDEGTSHDSGGQ